MNQTSRGVASGMAAGALWGAVFMAPVWVPDFSPLQLSAGRYLAYGVFAVLFLLVRPAGRVARKRNWIGCGGQSGDLEV